MNDSRPGRGRLVSRLWQYLTVSPNSGGDERQRLNAELLILLLIIGFVLGIPLGFLPTVVGARIDLTQSATWVIVMLTIPAGLLGWYFNRRGWVKIASWYIILNAIFALYAGMLYEAPVTGVLTLYYLVVPLYLSSLFFSAASVIWVTLICLVLYLSFPILLTDISYAEILNGPVRLLILSGAFVALYCRFRDTLEERRQSTVRRREAQQRLLLETAFDGAILHEDWLIREISEAGATILGYDANHLEGASFLTYLTAQSAAALQALHTATANVEISAVRPDGTLVILELISRQQLVDNQKIGFAAFRDITERRELQRTNDALRAFSASLRQADSRQELPPVILDNLIYLFPVDSAALFMVRDDQTIELELMRGLARPADTSLPLQDTIVGYALNHPKAIIYDRSADHPSPAADSSGFQLAASLRQNQVTSGVLWLSREDIFSSSDQQLLAQIVPIITAALERSGRHAATRDYAQELEQRVAERTQALVEANEQLKALDSLKSKFVSDVSHELRTPVTNLSLYLELLENGHPDKRQKYLQRLNHQTERLRKLLEDILNLSRLEIGGARPELGPVELNELLLTTLTAHKAKANAAGLTLSIDPATQPVVVWGERNQLIQVIDNLITNGLNYTDAGGVTVSAVRDVVTGRVGMRVADTGRGIVKADLPHVADRFYRGQSTDQSNIPGTGLGLAIVSEIVTIHKGELDIQSSEGNGTTVTIWLQPAEAVVAEAAGG